MTQIYFYSGSRNKLLTACRLCTKAVQQGLRIAIYTPDTALLEEFDKLLWTFSPTSFIPHCNIHDDELLVNATPVILSNEVPVTSSGIHFDAMLNLDCQHPPQFDQFNRLIEIVEDSQEDKLTARNRYRFYKDAGYEIQHYNLDQQNQSREKTHDG